MLHRDFHFTPYKDTLLARGWLVVQQDPQVLLHSWHMQLLLQKIHTFPLLHEDPHPTFFHAVDETSSAFISQFSFLILSANLLRVNSTPLSRTSMKMSNSRGCSSEPWGTLEQLLLNGLCVTDCIPVDLTIQIVLDTPHCSLLHTYLSPFP